MDIIEAGFHPFVYFTQFVKHHDRKALDTYRLCQRTAYTLWTQVEGTTELRRRGKRWTLRPGGVALAGPGTRTRFTRGSEVRLVAFDLVERPKGRQGRHWQILPDTGPQPSWQELFGQVLDPLVPADLVPRARHLAHAIHDTYWCSPVDHALANAMLAEWILELAMHLAGAGEEPASRDAGGRWKDLSTRAEELMRARFHSRATVGEIAEVLGVSRSHLSAEFKRVRGVTPGAHLRSLRVRFAMNVMRHNPRMDLEGVAQASGLRTRDALIDGFRAETGMTPSRWRQEYARGRSSPRGSVGIE